MLVIDAVEQGRANKEQTGGGALGLGHGRR